MKNGWICDNMMKKLKIGANIGKENTIPDIEDKFG